MDLLKKKKQRTCKVEDESRVIEFILLVLFLYEKGFPYIACKRLAKSPSYTRPSKPPHGHSSSSHADWVHFDHYYRIDSKSRKRPIQHFTANCPYPRWHFQLNHWDSTHPAATRLLS
jgi:hypothetical protein